MDDERDIVNPNRKRTGPADRLLDRLHAEGRAPTCEQTVDAWLEACDKRFAGRTMYEGRWPKWDEALAHEVVRLRTDRDRLAARVAELEAERDRLAARHDVLYIAVITLRTMAVFRRELGLVDDIDAAIESAEAAAKGGG